MKSLINRILVFLVLAGCHRSVIPPIRRDWTHPRVINSVNQAEMVYIPAGEFIMGSYSGESGSEPDELPQHIVYLDGYWISLTPVTNAMYNDCVQTGVCSYGASHKTNPRYLDPRYANHPVVYVTWKSAYAYCQWAGGRLPTEAEWEKAARGPDGQVYPWGNTRPNMQTTNAKNMVGDTTQVGMFTNDKSYYGLYDMGGNVREWVADWYASNYYEFSPTINPPGPLYGEEKVLKSASWNDFYRYTRAANRLSHMPDSPGANRGFRCVLQ